MFFSSCYARYICEFHPIKSSISFLVLSFDKLSMRILDHKKVFNWQF